MAKLFGRKQDDDEEEDDMMDDSSDDTNDDFDSNDEKMPSMKGNGGISPSKHFMKKKHGKKSLMKKKDHNKGKKGLSGFLAKMKGK